MLHYFNPGHEAAVLNASPHYTLPAHPLKMQQDLAFLPAWYADREDFVFVENLPDKTFLSSIADHFPFLPKVVSKNELVDLKDKLSGVQVSLWGLSPQGIHFFNQLNNDFNLNLNVPIWNDQYRHLCSRRTAKECLQAIISEIPDISPDIVPEFFDTSEKIEQVIREKNGVNLVIKSPYSSSGRGLLWIREGVLDRSSRQVLQGMLKRQQEVSLETALDKQTDFAMLFYANSDGVEFKAYSLFRTDEKGNYKGNVIRSQESIRSFLGERIDDALLEKVKQSLLRFLSRRTAPVYSGCIGVDMMLYRDNGQMRLHPCVEINFRYSMGWLAYALHRNFLNEYASGNFQITFTKQTGMILQRHKEMQSRYPIVIENNKVLSGYISLCPVTVHSNYLASLQVFCR